MPAVNVVEMSATVLARARAAATRRCRPPAIRSQRPDKMATAAAWLASGWTRTSLQEPKDGDRVLANQRQQGLKPQAERYWRTAVPKAIAHKILKNPDPLQGAFPGPGPRQRSRAVATEAASARITLAIETARRWAIRLISRRPDIARV